MEILKFLKNRKIEIIHWICILVFFLFMFIYTYGNFYNDINDIGKDFYISSEILQGQVLYKDIYHIYGPLGYFINSIMLVLFGNTLNTFYCIGFLLSLLILISIYKITNLFCNKQIGFAIVLFIICSCTFYPSLSNWISPYTYSILYALVAILWAIYYMLKYLNSENSRFIHIAFLLYGFSISSKYEFLGFILVLLFVLKYKKVKRSEYLISLLCLSVFPVISLAVLFISGCNIQDLIFAINYCSIEASKSSIENFYRFVGFIPTVNMYKNILHPNFYFFWGPLVILSVITLIIEHIKRMEIKVKLLNISAILLSLKTFFFVNLLIYGTFFLPLLFVNLVVFLYKLTNKKTILLVIICLFASLYFIHDIYIDHHFRFRTIQTEKGIIKLNPTMAEAVEEILHFSKNETTKEDSILYIPEGITLNYITGKNSDGYLYQTTLPVVNALGVDWIINRLEEKKYNYIVFSNTMYLHYGQSSFKESWGKEIYEKIQENYQKYKTIGNKYIEYEIYKIKNNE